MVETFHQESFLVHIGKAQRALDLLAAPCLAPVGNGIDQKTDHLEVVDKVDPAETDNFLFPSAVGVVIDDAGYAAYDLLVAVDQIEHLFTEFQGGILVAERVALIGMKGRNPIRTKLI